MGQSDTYTTARRNHSHLRPDEQAAKTQAELLGILADRLATTNNQLERIADSLEAE